MLVYQRVYPHFINISQDQQPVVKKNLSSMVIPWVMTMTLTWDDPPNRTQRAIARGESYGPHCYIP